MMMKWRRFPGSFFARGPEETPPTLKSAHVAQVDLGDRECAHVACENKLAAVVQVLLLDTRKPFDH